MAPSQTDMVLAFQKICCSHLSFLVGQWIDLVMKNGQNFLWQLGMFGLTMRHFNKVMLGYELFSFKACIWNKRNNDFGIYMHKKKCVRSLCIYFIMSQKRYGCAYYYVLWHWSNVCNAPLLPSLVGSFVWKIGSSSSCNNLLGSLAHLEWLATPTILPFLPYLQIKILISLPATSPSRPPIILMVKESFLGSIPKAHHNALSIYTLTPLLVTLHCLWLMPTWKVPMTVMQTNKGKTG